MMRLLIVGVLALASTGALACKGLTDEQCRDLNQQYERDRSAGDSIYQRGDVTSDEQNRRMNRTLDDIELNTRRFRR